jgi:TolA protein
VPTPAPTPEPTPAPQPPAPQPASRPANLEQKRAQFAAAEAERRKREEEAKKVAAAEAAEKARQQQASTQLDAKLADDISAIINTDQSTGATTGQGGSPTLGKPTGTSARLSQSEIDGLSGKIKQFWNLLPSESDSGLSVKLRINLNRDGSLVGTPQVLEADASSIGAAMSRAAQRAVMQAAPFSLKADAYDEWKQIDITLRP